jgi:hypothetical protein
MSADPRSRLRSAPGLEDYECEQARLKAALDRINAYVRGIQGWQTFAQARR